MTRSNKLFIIAAILVASSLACSLAAAAPTLQPTLLPPTSLPVATEPPPPAATPAVLIINSQDIIISNIDPRYDLKIYYPYLSGSSAHNNELNQKIKEFITKSQDDFISQAKQVEEWRKQNQPDGSSILNINYAVPFADERLVSLDLSLEYYNVGAAHGNHVSTTYNYNLADGKLLQLADLFTPGSKYLELIAKYCTDQLKPKLGDALFPDGLTSDAKNFQSWNILSTGLQLIFDPYQVGPFSAGTQMVTVPYATLKPILKPDGILSRFLK